MTIEEKARRYNEALSRAKAWVENRCMPSDTSRQGVLEDIFPELKESEDELTWLTKYIEEEAYSLSMDIRDNEDRIKLKKLQKALAWLERQSEIKWHSILEEPEEMRELLCEWDSNDSTWHEVAFYHSGNKTFWDGERQVENVTKWCYIDELLEKQDKQKQVKENRRI